MAAFRGPEEGEHCNIRERKLRPKARYRGRLASGIEVGGGEARIGGERPSLTCGRGLGGGCKQRRAGHQAMNHALRCT